MFDKLKPWDQAPFSYDVELFAATHLPQGYFGLSHTYAPALAQEEVWAFPAPPSW